MKIRIKLETEHDFKFWCLTPAININLHLPELEFEWLCFGIYIIIEPNKVCNSKQSFETKKIDFTKTRN